MKFPYFFVGALLLLASARPLTAAAGPLTDKAYRVAAQLGTRESSLTPSQQDQIQRSLDNVLAVLNGQSGPDRSYLCVSRDNDNSRPYAIAYKDFANIVRIPGAIFNSREECERSIASGFRVMDRLFVCATRDNDGSHPYKIVALNGTANALMLQRSVLNTLDECLSATRSMQVRPEGVLYCGSRDNDGSRPFAQTGFKFDGTFVPSREEYNSLSDCNNSL